MKLMILVTDGTSFIAVKQNGLLTNPSSDHWHKGQKKNNWPLAILKHLTYNMDIEWPEPVKQKVAFGLPSKMSWYVVKMETADICKIVRNAKINRLWWFRNAVAKPEWELKLIKIIDSKKKCDANTSHCINAFVAMK